MAILNDTQRIKQQIDKELLFDRQFKSVITNITNIYHTTLVSSLFSLVIVTPSLVQSVDPEKSETNIYFKSIYIFVL